MSMRVIHSFAASESVRRAHMGINSKSSPLTAADHRHVPSSSPPACHPPCSKLSGSDAGRCSL